MPTFRKLDWPPSFCGGSGLDGSNRRQDIRKRFANSGIACPFQYRDRATPVTLVVLTASVGVCTGLQFVAFLFCLANEITFGQIGELLRILLIFAPRGALHPPAQLAAALAPILDIPAGRRACGHCAPFRWRQAWRTPRPPMRKLDDRPEGIGNALTAMLEAAGSVSSGPSSGTRCCARSISTGRCRRLSDPVWEEGDLVATSLSPSQTRSC